MQAGAEEFQELQEAPAARRRLRQLAAAALVTTAAIHLFLVPEAFRDVAYLGALFAIGAAASAGGAVWLWRQDDRRAWLLGAVVSGGMALGLVISRTIGLPGFHETAWGFDAIISLLAEGVFLAAFGRWLAVRRRVAV